MAVPFTQYLLPNGERRNVVIDCTPETEAIAYRFIKSGGRYECEILQTGEVSLTAVKTVDGEPEDVEIEVCPNGPAIDAAVERLVQRSQSHIGEQEKSDD